MDFAMRSSPAGVMLNTPATRAPCAPVNTPDVMSLNVRLDHSGGLST